jgi:coenzyme F420 hydrogenase subunit beta
LAKLAELLALPGRFAFVGKPCDVAALRRYETLNPSISERVPFMLSFMCAGIPSRKGTLAILEKFGVAPDKVKSFAYRGDGWPGKTTAITFDNQRFDTDYSTSWGTVLNRHLQFRCKICPDGTGEFADVVGADAWYGKDGYPDFTEREGRSLVLSRTTKGEALVQNASAAHAISIEPLAVEEIAKMQPYQLNRKRLVLSRIAALWFTRRPAPRYINFPLIKLSWQLSLRENISSFKGTLSRLIN